VEPITDFEEPDDDFAMRETRRAEAQLQFQMK
jgi:hypothetical protein